MKKCILIGALAALMLFAFTACEQPSINYPTEYKGIAVVETGEPSTYLAGEDFDFRGIQVIAYFLDGTSENISNTAVTVTDGDSLADNAVVKLSYLGQTTTITPVVEKIASIEATTTDTTAYAKIAGANGSATENFKGNLTVTAYNADKSLSRVLENAEYTATYDSTAAGTDKTITVTMGEMTPETQPTIDVVLDTVSDYELVNAKERYFIGDAKALATNFTLNLSWASGEKTEDATIADYLIYDETNVTSNSGNFVNADRSGWSVTTYLKANESVSKVARVTVSDSVDSVTASLKENTKVERGGAINGSLFNVAVKMKSNPSAETGTTVTSGIKVSTDGSTWVDSIPVSHLEENPNITVYVGVEMNGAPVVGFASSLTVPVNLPTED